jgi:RimJ/RimL family protein N-acetyltransferase
MGTQQLTGDLVRLRPYQVTDAPAVWAAIDEDVPGLARWVPGVAAHRTLAQVQRGLTELVAARIRRERFVFGIWDRASDSYAGEVGLYRIDPARQCAELGYWLRPTAQRRGRVTEAVRLLLQHGSTQLGLCRFEAHIAVENDPSRRVAERAGFEIVGRRPVVPRWDGCASEVLVYAREAPHAGGLA